MAGQGLIPRMQRPLPSRQNRRGHGGRIVPPQLSRHAAEKLESLHHAVQDGFDPFGRQRDRKRTIRMCPSHQQHVHQTATVWEVDVNVPKVGFGPLSWSMVQREKRFPFADPVLAHIAANLVIAARVPRFDKVSKELCCRMALLGRCRQVGLQDLVHDRNEGPQLRRSQRLRACIRFRFRSLQSLADLPPRAAILFGDRPNAHPIAMSQTNGCVVFHRKHPCLLHVGIPR